MATDRWAIQAGEPRTPGPEGYPPKVWLEEFLSDDRLESQLEDVNDPRLAEAIAVTDLETGGNPHMRDADYSFDLIELYRSLTESEVLDEDEAFARLVDECRKARLFGPGAAIAKLDTKHSAREDIRGYDEGDSRGRPRERRQGTMDRELREPHWGAREERKRMLSDPLWRRLPPEPRDRDRKRTERVAQQRQGGGSVVAQAMYRRSRRDVPRGVRGVRGREPCLSVVGATLRPHPGRLTASRYVNRAPTGSKSMSVPESPISIPSASEVTDDVDRDDPRRFRRRSPADPLAH